MSATVPAVTTEIRRDDRGRMIADDGLPINGLCSVQEVAALTGLALSTIYGMMTAGEIPSRRFGRARRIPWSAVRELLQVAAD